MKSDISDIKKIFSKVLKIKKNIENTNYKNCKNWDSLNHVKLIIAIQSKTKKKIDPDQALKLDSFKAIVKYLKSI
jgi:acyl carrier protein|tara:strand:- start:387 stop:611 length:225 start_codon:yes stop_codon:yes gene_type:complete